MIYINQYIYIFTKINMKTLILLSLFFKAFSLTKDYVSNCLVGFEDIDILSAVECGKYSPGNGYCCLLSYDNKKKRSKRLYSSYA